MPEIGDRDIGLNIGNHSWGYYEFDQCPHCGNSRWVAIKTLDKQSIKGLCKKCFGKTRRGIAKPTIQGINNPKWRGGRTLMKTGYIRVPMYANDPLFAMASHDGRNKRSTYNHSFTMEHRLVMARHLGRCLESWEIVHHKNGDKTDNRIENLELLPNKDSRQVHMAFTLLQQENTRLKERIATLESRVTQLEANIVLGEKYAAL